MSIKISEIEHLAKLAKLNLSEEEKTRLTDEMSNILDFAHKIEELDAADISPTMHVLKQTNVFREDEVSESYKTEDILKNAAQSDEGCFLVPKAVE